jgi:uncharacterized protein DUF4055
MTIREATYNARKGAVNHVSQAVADQLPAWRIVSALLGGTFAMRKARTEYLPQWPNEEAAAYENRLAMSTLFPAFGRTVATLSARPFSKPLTYEGPAKMKQWLENADMQGRDLNALCSGVFPVPMAWGFGGLVVDHPPNPGARSAADEAALGLRPYIVPVLPEQILGWRAETADGVQRLTQVRIIEQVEVPEGDFGTAFVWQVRVLNIGFWQVWRMAADGKGWGLFDEGPTTLKGRVNFVPLYGKRAGFMLGEAPLLEMAHLNVKHWQSQSDQDYLLHVARVPILTARGVEDDFALVIGGATAVNLGRSEKAELKYVEHTGAAIEAGAESLEALEEAMRQSGAELLVLRPGPATATEVASDNAVGMCALQDTANKFEDAVNDALSMMAEFGGQDSGGEAKLFSDFGAATLAEASASLLSGLSNSGGLSRETLFHELQRRGILAADLKWEEEKARIDAEGLNDPEPEPGPGGE